MSLDRSRLKDVAVLDVAGSVGRRLEESVRATGFSPRPYPGLDPLGAALQSGEAYLAVLAYEALSPVPEKALRALRQRAPESRLLVAFPDGDLRLRPVEPLSPGLFDALLPRSTPPKKLGAVLKQAFADLLIEARTRELEGQDPASAERQARARALRQLGAALLGQRSVDGVFRELCAHLPGLSDVQVIGLLGFDKGRPRFDSFQVRPAQPEAIWDLADEVTITAAPHASMPLGPEDLLAEPRSGDLRVPRERLWSYPLVSGGELQGCLGLLLGGPLGAEARSELPLIGQLAASAIRAARLASEPDFGPPLDELTGVYDRHFLGRALEAEWRRSRRYKSQFSVVLLDLDSFDRLNEAHGHLAGDELLRGLARVLRESLRDTDLVIRYGGEEFLLLLPETGPKEAEVVLERTRLLLERQPLRAHDTPVRLSFSAGVASYPSVPAEVPEKLLRAAEEALREAKREGGGRFRLASESSAAISSRPTGRANKRRFQRTASEVKVGFLELAEFDPRAVSMETTDVSAGGAAIRGPSEHLRRNAYALVFLGNDQRPVLSRVVWTRDSENGLRTAGLEFVRGTELPRGPFAPMGRAKALLLLESTAVRRVVERVAAAARCEPKSIAATPEALERERLEDYALVVVGESALKGELGQKLAERRLRPGQPWRLVVIGEAEDRRRALETIHSHRLTQLLSPECSPEALFSTLAKLVLDDFFGVRKYLMSGASTRWWTVADAEQKAQVLEGIEEVARSVQCHPRLVDLLVAAVDEMLVNALSSPRSGPEEPLDPVVVECGSDGRLLAVAVRDEHGRFRAEEMFRGIGEALELEAKGLPPESSKANLGFRIMLSNLSHLVVNVDPGRCTEIIGIIDLNLTLRALRATAPSVGLFTREQELPPLPKAAPRKDGEG
ncbi:MAG: diguanylate cyclase [Myxococcales bacterium]|nr:diguanylate cyclase [Myxococcales bacterium]